MAPGIDDPLPYALAVSASPKCTGFARSASATQLCEQLYCQPSSRSTHKHVLCIPIALRSCRPRCRRFVSASRRLWTLTRGGPCISHARAEDPQADVPRSATACLSASTFMRWQWSALWCSRCSRPDRQARRRGAYLCLRLVVRQATVHAVSVRMQVSELRTSRQSAGRYAAASCSLPGRLM
jgi:hypothetical protein